MKAKKQSVAFLNVNKHSKKPFLTNDLGISIEQGSGEPLPVNRKSRRAMPKLVKAILKEESDEEKTTKKLQLLRKKNKRKKKNSNVVRRQNKNK